MYVFQIEHFHQIYMFILKIFPYFYVFPTWLPLIFIVFKSMFKSRQIDTSLTAKYVRKKCQQLNMSAGLKCNELNSQ